MPPRLPLGKIERYHSRVPATLITQCSVSRAAGRMQALQSAAIARPTRRRVTTGGPLPARSGNATALATAVFSLLGPAWRLLQDADRLRCRLARRRGTVFADGLDGEPADLAPLRQIRSGSSPGAFDEHLGAADLPRHAGVRRACFGPGRDVVAQSLLVHTAGRPSRARRVDDLPVGTVPCPMQ